MKIPQIIFLDFWKKKLDFERRKKLGKKLGKNWEKIRFLDFFWIFWVGEDFSLQVL